MIQIDSDVFNYQPERDMSNERFVVTGVQDAAPVTAALVRASERFMMVDSNGVEHPTDESLSDAVSAGADWP